MIGHSVCQRFSRKQIQSCEEYVWEPGRNHQPKKPPSNPHHQVKCWHELSVKWKNTGMEYHVRLRFGCSGFAFHMSCSHPFFWTSVRKLKSLKRIPVIRWWFTLSFYLGFPNSTHQPDVINHTKCHIKFGYNLKLTTLSRCVFFIFPEYLVFANDNPLQGNVGK